MRTTAGHVRLPVSDRYLEGRGIRINGTGSTLAGSLRLGGDALGGGHDFSRVQPGFRTDPECFPTSVRQLVDLAFPAGHDRGGRGRVAALLEFAQYRVEAAFGW